jgi:hypothetical protein
MVFLGPSAPLVRAIEGAVLTGVFERSRTAIEEIEAAHPAKPLGLARIPPWNWIIYPTGTRGLQGFERLDVIHASLSGRLFFGAGILGGSTFPVSSACGSLTIKATPCRAALAMIGTVLRHIECPNNPPVECARKELLALA